MTDTAAGRRRLGRGLEALLGPTREEAEREGSLVELPVKDVRPNPFQPRKTMDPAALEELVSSIKQAGLLQPIVVRRQGERFQLVAGERRLRAAIKAGLGHVAVQVRELGKDASIERERVPATVVVAAHGQRRASPGVQEGLHRGRRHAGLISEHQDEHLALWVDRAQGGRDRR